MSARVRRFYRALHPYAARDCGPCEYTARVAVEVAVLAAVAWQTLAVTGLPLWAGAAFPAGIAAGSIVTIARLRRKERRAAS